MMYQPATRVLAVLELLQTYQQLSGQELARRLEVDIRTVRRYIMMLQDLGIPVEAEHGRYGGYKLQPGFKLPPLMFTEDEAVALTLGLLLARTMRLGAEAVAVEGALSKIERVLPDTLRERVQTLQATLEFDIPSPNVTPDSTLVMLLSDAVRYGRQVRVRYRSGRGEATERLIDPYGLVYREGYWYLAGYCHLRAGMRIFRMDRMLQIKRTDGAFTRPAEFDTLDYVARSFAMIPGPWPVEVLLVTTLEKAKHLLPVSFGLLEQTPQGVVLRCYVGNLDWMASFLAGLGCPLAIYQPPELRDAVRRLAARLTTLADTT